MLELTVRVKDDWNLVTEEFETEDYELQLEHSLISLSKWESIHEKAYLGPEPKSDEEVQSYIKCMIVNHKYPEDILEKLTEEHAREIEKYINARMSATTINDIRNPGSSSEIITSELVYFWIVSYEIPWDVEHWHLNRLFTLIRLFSAKNSTKDSRNNRINQQQIAQRNRILNEQRRRESGSTG